jgi:hypothetical protein
MKINHEETKSTKIFLVLSRRNKEHEDFSDPFFVFFFRVLRFFVVDPAARGNKQ